MAAVWFNHFENGFHFDDFHTIVNNRAIRSFSRVPHFFATARTFSDLPEYADYRPLLSTSFALDYAVTGGAAPSIFQTDNFVWFTLQVFFLYLLFRLIPGGTHQSSLFAAALCGLHPLAADTVNYSLQRGAIVASVGIATGLVIWIVWPRRLPQTLPLNLQRTPENWHEETMLKQAARLNAMYRRVLDAPLGLYLYPVVAAMLWDPAAAVFAPILVAYILLFEPERGVRRALPAILVCGGYWVTQAALTWRFANPSRLPFTAYWLTQPWVAMRYLYAFFVPTGLTADSDLQPLAQFWSPAALAGYAGLALLVILAMVTARRVAWRAVSFGIWWFLLALLPTAIVPQRAVEADTRIFVPMAGLALAVTRAAWIGWARLSERPRIRVPAAIVASIIGAAVLLGCAWQTWLRNQVWESEETLWLDTMKKSPRNARAFINYGLALIARGDSARGLDYLEQALPRMTRSAALETDLALGFDQLNKDGEAEAHFRKAIAIVPAYARGYSSYGRWLLDRGRTSEASAMASRAVQLEPMDLAGRQTLMALYSQRFDWGNLERAADEALRLDPDDPASQNYRLIASTTAEGIRKTEELARAHPGVDQYLSLSVLYFRNRRYEDCVNAAREAVKLKPDLAEGYANMATAYHNLGRDDDAIAALREVVRLRPDFTFARRDLDILLEQKAGAPPK